MNLLDMFFTNISDDVVKVSIGIIAVLTVVSIALAIVRFVKPEARIGELISRTKSWWIMCGIFFFACFINNVISYCALGLLSFFAFRELYSVLGFRDSDREALLLAIIAIPIQYYLAYINWYGWFIILIPIIMFLVLPIILVLKGDTHRITKSMAMLQWTLMLSVFGISHLAYLLSMQEPDISKNAVPFTAGGRGLLLFVVVLTEINDVMQFVWGKLLGRHKIVPKVSPNKTWEGFVGGILSTTIIGYFMRFLTPLTEGYAIFVSFMVAISGFFGDVVLSAIKRDKGIKDMGDVIPGHGGIFDRIDSLSYTAPVFFHLVYYLAFPHM